MNYKIMFHDGSNMKMNDVKLTLNDHGIYTKADEGNIFIPYGSIKFIAESENKIKIKKNKNKVKKSKNNVRKNTNNIK